MQQRRKWMLMILVVTEMMVKMMRRRRTWKSKYSRVRSVRMFYRSWTRLLQNLGFERAQMSLCCKSQWKLARRCLELQGHDTRHLTRASLLSMTMRSRQEAANLWNENKSQDCSAKLTLEEIRTSNWPSKMMIKNHKKGSRQEACKTPLRRPQNSQEVL